MHLCVGTCIHVRVGVACVGRGEERKQQKKSAKVLLVFFCILNKEVIRGHIPNFFSTL